ncbi:glycosyltransferase [Fundicoccus sp. Sow4_D5]|uniref:glycosyltransferase n=1 Tax=Fundicoccus sp. Sow4_D5 TaxID=3438782 RepID=UPI003F8EB6B7
MKNIVIFNQGYLPATSYGGPVVSITNIVTELNENFNFYIICTAYELDGINQLPDIILDKWNSGNNGEQILYLSHVNNNFSFIKKSLFQIESIDLIYVNSFFNAKQLFYGYKVSKAFNCPFIIAPRGELEENALKIKSYKKKPYVFIMKRILNKNVYYQSTSELEGNNIMKILDVKNFNVLDLPNLPSIPQSINISKYNKKSNEIKMCFISRIQVKKNLVFALECLYKVSSEIKITFDIYGTIENEAYWKQCLKLIDKMPSNVIVNYNGVVSRDKIFETFSRYDLFFFPTLSENYGHVIGEALYASCPILISDQTPWTDINDTYGGRAYSLDGKNKFVDYIEEIAMSSLTSMNIIKNSAKKFVVNKSDIENKKNKYIKIFNELMI